MPARYSKHQAICPPGHALQTVEGPLIPAHAKGGTPFTYRTNNVCAELFLDIDADLPIRGSPHECGDIVEQGLGNCRRAGYDPDLSSEIAHHPGNIRLDSIERIKEITRMQEQSQTGLRGSDAPWIALHERCTQRRLQRSDPFADRGWLNMLALGRAPHTAQLAN